MSVQINNDGATLKIIDGANTRLISKAQIREISLIKNNIIRLNLGLGALHNVYINYPDVTDPVTANPDALREAINTMMQSLVSGGATEQHQIEEINSLSVIQNSLNDLKGKFDGISDKLFIQPLLVDESNPLTIYRGFAAPGSATNAAVWAVQRATINGDITTFQWAAGNKNFDKIWDNRAALIFS